VRDNRMLVINERLDNNNLMDRILEIRGTELRGGTNSTTYSCFVFE
jgi:hypothetical protein